MQRFYLIYNLEPSYKWPVFNSIFLTKRYDIEMNFCPFMCIFNGALEEFAITSRVLGSNMQKSIILRK